MANDVEVLAYYFPQYHADPRNDRLHRPGWTEWEVLAACRPRFIGHSQPKVPADGWGVDESSPEAAARTIAAASDAGLRGFIVDWYWYDDAPFLNGFLDRGLLAAPNRDDIRLALMWANHPYVDLYPAPFGPQQQLFAAPTSRYAVERAMEHLLEHYLSHPLYWRIDGRPYFSIFDVVTLIEGLGGLHATRRVLDWMRGQARIAGLDLHLNLVTLPSIADPRRVLVELGADSTTHYTWWHHADNGFTGFPTSNYADVHVKAVEAWQHSKDRLGTPYIPNVTVGWDPSPRARAWENDRDRGYPYTSILADGSPAELASALDEAVAFASSGFGPAAVTINAWNEWTEGSYLEPDQILGTQRLDAIRSVLRRGGD